MIIIKLSNIDDKLVILNSMFKNYQDFPNTIIWFIYTKYLLGNLLIFY